MKDYKLEMMREMASRMKATGFETMGMEAAKAKLEQHLNGGISSARDRLRESAQCEQTVLALNDLLNQTQKNAMLLVQDNDRLRAELAELRNQPAVPDDVAKDAARYRWLRDRNNSLETRQYDKGIHNGPSCYHEVGGIRELKSGSKLDTAIDAAILSAADSEVKK